jgi:C-methyltransferase C-terminal domain/Putative zinc binding domain
MSNRPCRACRGRNGQLVLDLGAQPACDYFPGADDPGPDPEYPLQMWLCSACGLAQLMADPTVPEEPRGAEPAALAAQAADAVRQVAEAGLLRAGGGVAEYGSPHGGSWLSLMAGRQLTPVTAGQPADVVLDCFGLMHAADQSRAMAERAARVAPGGMLLLQYHSLAAIVRHGQWNALRHGHYAYYSTTALTALLAAYGFSARAAWEFGLYGGTVLLAATRAGEKRVIPGGPAGGEDSVRILLAREARAGVRDPAVLAGLAGSAQAQAAGLREYLVRARSAGQAVIGYGAASRGVALVRWAGADRSLLPAIVDASPAKHGLRLPGTDIPIVSPDHLAAARPAAVLLFLADLLPEVRDAYPVVEGAGGRWVPVDTLGSRPASR